jgi:hypothetical protein
VQVARVVALGGLAASNRANLAEALRQLTEYGLLMLQDPLLPCVVTIVAGGPIRGSWLSNPMARGTYQVLVALEEHPDVLHTKLLEGKVTMVHRRLWPDVVAAAKARATWQLNGLTPVAKWLLDSVDRETSLQTDLLSPPIGVGRKAIPNAARELERCLLVHAIEVHTPSGKHAKVLQTWDRWLTETQLELDLPSQATARQRLEEVAARINHDCGASARLPWQRSSRNAVSRPSRT